MRQIALLTLLMCALVTSCKDTPVEPELEDIEIQAAQHQYKELDSYLADLVDEIPGYGGHYFQDGKMKMNIREDFLAPGKTGQILSQIRGTWLHEEMEIYGYDEQSIELVKSSYDFKQLKKWRDSARKLLGVSDIVFLDIDEVNGKLSIGLLDRGSFDQIRSFLANEGVPREAVKLFVDEPIQLFNRRPPEPALPCNDCGGGTSTLTSEHFEMWGGLSIETQQNDGPCTLGVVGQLRGIFGFLTNSHCGITEGQVDSGQMYQPDFESSRNIGYEEEDPSPSTGICPAGVPNNKPCRYSDSAWYVSTYGAGISARGIIHKPFEVGSIQVFGDFFKVEAVQKLPWALPTWGSDTHKVGRSTGWTNGPHRETCFDAPTTNVTYLCQGTVSATSSGGDSGAPVFHSYPNRGNFPSTDIMLLGLQIGKMSNGDLVYSFFDSIAWEIAGNYYDLNVYAQ